MPTNTQSTGMENNDPSKIPSKQAQLRYITDIRTFLANIPSTY